MKSKREFLQNTKVNMTKKQAQPHQKTESSPPGISHRNSGSWQDLNKEVNKKAADTGSNSNKQKGNKYYIQPYNKYGSSSPAADASQKQDTLKYRLPASTKALLHSKG